MAEFVMKDIVQKAGYTVQSEDGEKADFVIASAATSTEELGNRVYPPARKKMAEHGISCEGKRARQITKADYSEYDYLIGMDNANIRNMKRWFGDDPEGKIFKLMEFAGSGRDVADPWYTRDFEATWKDVTEGCRGLLEHLISQDR